MADSMWTFAVETDVAQYGLIGLVLAAFFGGKLISRPVWDQLREDKAAVEKQRDELIRDYQDRVIPLLASVAPSLAAAVHTIEETAADDRQAVADEIALLRATVEGLLAREPGTRTTTTSATPAVFNRRPRH